MRDDAEQVLIHVQVTDAATASPLADAEVEVVTADAGEREPSPLARATTDPDGFAELALPADAWCSDLSIRAVGEPQSAVPVTRAMRKGTSAASVTVAGADAADRADLALLSEHLVATLAACDLAVVQGGLTTTMELTAAGRPFLFFPLRHHFEQTYHVRHRLERYGAGRAMDFALDGPEQIADAIAEELVRPVSYRPVDPGGAARAAALIAELLT